MVNQEYMTKENHKSNFRLFVLFPIFAALYETSAYLSNDMYLPALPEIRNFLDISIEQAQNTITVWFLGNCLFQLLIGPLSDKYGRRPIMFAGAAIFVVGCLICAKATNIKEFYFGRFLQGLMVPTCLITAYSILHEYFSTQKAIQVLAWMGSIVIIGPAIGPLIGSFVLLKYEWQMIFYILIICALIPVVVLYFVMPESKELRIGDKISLMEIFQNYKKAILNKRFLSYSLIFSFNIFAPISWIVAGPFLAIEKFKISTTDFGLIQLEIFGAYAFACILVNKISTRFNPFGLLKFGQKICVLSSIVSVILSNIFIDNINVVVASLVINSIGNAFVLATSNRLAIESSIISKSYSVAMFFMIINVSITFVSKFVTEVFDFHVQEFCYLMLGAAICSQILIALLSFSKK